MRSPACLLLLTSALTAGLVACTSHAPPPQLAPAPVPRLAPAPPPPPVVPPGHLGRAEVDRILTSQGPPWLLRQVIVDVVLRRDGEFSGWRLVGLPEDWRGVDVRPGDVLTRINGLPLKNPEQFWDVWTSVARSPDLRIDLLRDGAPRQVIVPIDGAPSAETARALAHDSGPPRAANEAPPGQRSIQLGGPPVEGSEEDAY